MYIYHSKRLNKVQMRRLSSLNCSNGGREIEI